MRLHEGQSRRRQSRQSLPVARFSRVLHKFVLDVIKAGWGKRPALIRTLREHNRANLIVQVCAGHHRDSEYILSYKARAMRSLPLGVTWQ